MSLFSALLRWKVATIAGVITIATKAKPINKSSMGSSSCRETAAIHAAGSGISIGVFQCELQPQIKLTIFWVAAK
jgi:hypothetical protein